MPTTQTVVMTPSTNITPEAALQEIAALLPVEVINHLSATSGGWSTTLSSDGNTHTAVTVWSDDNAMQTYKTLMADVSASVKFQLVADGWDITFTPETADL